jgi:hypothetical protein
MGSSVPNTGGALHEFRIAFIVLTHDEKIIPSFKRI